MKRQSPGSEKTFENDKSEKIYNSLYNLIKKKKSQTTRLKKWAEDLNRHVSKEDIQRPTDT